MKVYSVHNFNQNVQFKNRQAYSLYSLTTGYSKLKPAEKNLLNKNHFSKESLISLLESLEEIPTSVNLDKFNEHPVLIRRDNFIFEIGETCRLLLDVFFRGIRIPNKILEFAGDDISKDSLSMEYEKIKNEYKEFKQNMQGGTKEEFYNSKTLSILDSPEYKIAPQKTEKGYLTTIINNETKSPERAYIEIRENAYNCSLFLSTDNNFTKHPNIDICGYTDEFPQKTTTIGVLDFKYKNGDVTDINFYTQNMYSSIDYSGVGYRLIQALIEYSQHNNGNITIRCIPENIPFYTKVGFRVNPEKDVFIPDSSPDYYDFLKMMLKECDNYNLPREQLKKELIKRTKNGISGIGRNETIEIFNRLLWQKSKNLFYASSSLPLELTPEAKEQWLKRIKAQPILDINQ